MALGYLRNSGKAIVPIPPERKIEARVRLCTYFNIFLFFSARF